MLSAGLLSSANDNWPWWAAPLSCSPCGVSSLTRNNFYSLSFQTPPLWTIDSKLVLIPWFPSIPFIFFQIICSVWLLAPVFVSSQACIFVSLPFTFFSYTLLSLPGFNSAFEQPGRASTMTHCRGASCDFGLITWLSDFQIHPFQQRWTLHLCHNGLALLLLLVVVMVVVKVATAAVGAT